MVVKIIICLALGYLLGCFSTGYLIGKINKIDIRNYGSGNAGTTNALRTLGAKAGALTLIGDMLKSVLAVVLVRFVIFPDLEITNVLSLYAGLGVVLGHNYPFWLKFKGGKGAAATGGAMFAFDLRVFPFVAFIFLGTVAITKYVSVGSLLVSILFPVWILVKFPGDIHLFCVSLLFTASIFIKHIPNIKRLMNGTENKIGQKVKIDK